MQSSNAVSCTASQAQMRLMRAYATVAPHSMLSLDLIALITFSVFKEAGLCRDTASGARPATAHKRLSCLL